MNTEQAYAKGYDCGFNAEYLAGVQDGYGQGYDDATKTMIKEASFWTAQVLSKEYKCLTCDKPIKISKIDNAGPNARKKWEKFKRDGTTPHQCSSNSNNNSSSANNYNPNKKYHEQNRQEQEEVSSPQTVTMDNGPQLAELVKQVSDLKEIAKALISQVQMLRSEVKAKK